jgi:hypothetical protein
MFMPATTQLDAAADSVIEVGPYFCALQVDRGQATLLPECLEDWVDESNPIRVIDTFVDALDLRNGARNWSRASRVIWRSLAPPTSNSTAQGGSVRQPCYPQGF